MMPLFRTTSALASMLWLLLHSVSSLATCPGLPTTTIELSQRSYRVSVTFDGLEEQAVLRLVDAKERLLLEESLSHVPACCAEWSVQSQTLDKGRSIVLISCLDVEVVHERRLLTLLAVTRKEARVAWEGIEEADEDHEVLEIADLDGDGSSELVTSRRRPGLYVCGRESARINPHVFDWGRLEFRAVAIKPYSRGEQVTELRGELGGGTASKLDRKSVV